MTTNSAGYAGESPETRPESIDEQVRRKGVRAVESVKDMTLGSAANRLPGTRSGVIMQVRSIRGTQNRRNS